MFRILAPGEVARLVGCREGAGPDTVRPLTPPRDRPPLAADERTQLVGWLDLQRALVHYKCAGPSDADAHRALLPTSPLMTMAGLVSHLRGGAGRRRCSSGARPGRTRSSGTSRTPTSSSTTCRWRNCSLTTSGSARVSNEITAAASLDDTGRHPDFGAAAGTLRWMLIHLVEEVPRHVGQMDVLRERSTEHRLLLRARR